MVPRGDTPKLDRKARAARDVDRHPRCRSGQRVDLRCVGQLFERVTRHAAGGEHFEPGTKVPYAHDGTSTPNVSRAASELLKPLLSVGKRLRNGGRAETDKGEQRYGGARPGDPHGDTQWSGVANTDGPDNGRRDTGQTEICGAQQCG